MLIGADVVIDEILSTRLVWITGMNRTHKTALAYRLAHELMRSGKFNYIVSNVPDVWSTPVESVVPENKIYLKCVFIFDEIGEYINTDEEKKVLESFMGKFQSVVIGVSRAVPKGRYPLQIYPVFQLHVIGLPCVIYRWTYKFQATKDSGIFLWWKPSEIYGIYDSDCPVVSDMGIMDLLIDHKRSVQRSQPRKNKFVNMGGGKYGILRLDQEKQESEGSVEQTVQASKQG